MPNNLVVDKILSVIVPVYNVESTLERCVRSIEEQDLSHEEFEVILVNDGSTDNSLDIANDLASHYGNIIVISKENGGLSSARNAGMDKATGKFMMFIDSDDYLYPNCLAYLVKRCIEEKLDVLHFFLNVEEQDGSCNRKFPSTIQFDRIYSSEELIRTGLLIGSVCSNIIRTSVIKVNGLRFHEGIVHEDTEFTTRFFCYVRSISFADKDVYHYSYNPQSLLRDRDVVKIRKNFFDSATVASLAIDFANNQTDISSVCRDAILRLNNTGLIGVLISCLRNPQFPVAMMADYLTYAHSLGVYPVRGKFLNRRTKLLSKLFNHSKIYMMMYKWRKN